LYFIILVEIKKKCLSKSFYIGIIIMENKKSSDLYYKACQLMPGGVNSPVRAFGSVGGEPVFIKKGVGSKIYDVDGNKYIDYIGSWGPHIFGHNAPFIKKALAKALEHGTSFGAPTEKEVEMAELITEMIPSMGMVRMVNSGTEATMSAVRLARGYTGKSKIIKFEGCYHGHGDSFLIKAGSGALTFGEPTSPGVTQGTAQDTLNARYNDIESVRKLVESNKGEIAAVIIEPIAGNMGVVEAKYDFMKQLRQLCLDEKIVLIFDEVMTGFRVARGGAQELYKILPDLTTFGKIIGGGLPVGAFGGRKEIMSQLSPMGAIYQAGTLSGNPLAMSAGVATLKYIKENPDIYEKLEQKSAELEAGLKECAKISGVDAHFARRGSMLCMFFTDQEVVDFDTAITCDTKRYGEYFHGMLDQGVYLAPSQFESMFVSTTHTGQDINKTIDACYNTFKNMK
jgi:glutamate-1-semialdehyde 2,1-aminomutase